MDSNSNSTLTTIMYYLMHILAIFGLVFLLILLVRITLWCLMCNLKHEKKRRNTRMKLKALSKAEAGQMRIPSPPTLRRSPNVQRLNLIKPEDEKKFVDEKSNTLKSKISESSSEGTLPPTPPPKDIEAQDENIQQSADDVSPLYASLTFPKRRAPVPPTPPPKQAACICPFCKAINRASLKPVEHHEDDEQEVEQEEQKVQEHQEQEHQEEEHQELETPTRESLSSSSSDGDIEVITTEEIRQIEQTELVISQTTSEDDPEMVTIDTNELNDAVSDEMVVVPENGNDNDNKTEEKAQEEQESEPIELRPLPKTPSPEPVEVKSLSSSSESLATQSALDSLDQAIEEMDAVINDLVVIVEENKKLTADSTQLEEALKPESDQMLNYIEPENSVAPQNDEQPEITETQQNETPAEIETEIKTEIEIEIEIETVASELPDSSESSESTQTKEQETNESDTKETEVEETKATEPETMETIEPEVIETEPAKPITKEPELELAKAEPVKPEPVEPENEIAIVRRSLRKTSKENSLSDEQHEIPKAKITKLDPESRRKSAPRIVESVPKVRPTVPDKPKKLVFRAKSLPPPVNGTNGEPLPQCMIYAQVIDQIKKRNQDKVTDSSDGTATNEIEAQV